MMQGDAYGLNIVLLYPDKTAVKAEDVSDVEITIGYLRKTYASGQVTFNEETGKWVFPMTQEETFRFPVTRVKAQARIVWPGGGVEGVSLGTINVLESISKEVL